MSQEHKNSQKSPIPQTHKGAMSIYYEHYGKSWPYEEKVHCPVTHFTNSLWAHDENLVEILFAFVDI